MPAAACPIGSQDFILQNRLNREVVEGEGDCISIATWEGGGKQGTARHLLIN